MAVPTPDELTRELDELREVTLRAEQTRARVEERVLTDGVHVDAEPSLRAELRAIDAAPNPVRQLRLHYRIAGALRAVGRYENGLQEMIVHYGELNGRLKGYRAMSDRHGLGEDSDVSRSYRVAKEILSRQPCDLDAAERAVVDYQGWIQRKSR